MSRHTVPALIEGIEITVGWDPPLATFFVQVCRVDAADDDETMLLWLGTSPREITQPEDLVAPLSRLAMLSAALLAQLAADRAACADNGSTALQRAMLARPRTTS